MGRYVVRRLLQVIPVLIGVTFIIFCLVFALPGDPIQALAGDKRADPNIAAILRAHYHLNEPLYSSTGTTSAASSPVTSVRRTTAVPSPTSCPSGSRSPSSWA